MPYRQVDPRLHDDEKFASLTDSQQMLWVTLLTGYQVSIVPGLMVAGIATLAEIRRRPTASVEADLSVLVHLGMVELDETTRVIRLPNAPKYAEIRNGNQLRGWFKAWKALPESPLKYRHVATLRSQLKCREPWFAETWSVTFGSIDTDHSSEPHLPFSLAGTVREQSRNQEQEQEQEQRTPLPPAARSVALAPTDVGQRQGVFFQCAERTEAPNRKPPRSTPAPPEPTIGFRPAMLDELDAAWAQRCADRGMGVEPDVRVRRRVFGRLLAQAREDPKLAIEAMDQLPCLRGDSFYDSRGFDLTVLENRIAKLIQRANEARREKQRRREDAERDKELMARYGAEAKTAERVMTAETRRATAAASDEEIDRRRLDGLARLRKEMADDAKGTA